jgi:hypothetical protein
MKEYESIPRVQDDGTLLGEDVWAFNKLDGQNFRAKYVAKGHDKKQFTLFGSRHQLVDENTEGFGDAVRYFKKYCESTLKAIITLNSGKKGIFNGVDEIIFFFEWYGDNSFAGFHQEGDTLRLVLTDVFLKKKGYIEPKDFFEIFCKCSSVLTPELIYHGKLTKGFIDSIINNDWTQEGCEYPTVKEGVVCKKSSLMKGQRLPKCKFKTKWWLDKLHNTFSEEECKKLE